MISLKQKSVLMLALIMAGCSSDSNGSSEVSLQKGYNKHLTYIGSYSTGNVSEDGGIAEIVAYNKDNQKIYVVNGALGSIDIVDANTLSSDQFTQMELYKRIDIAAMANEKGFSYGDVTSVDTKDGIVALAVQAEGYADNGSIVILNYEGEFLGRYEAGVQPDMICFADRYILSANEGEPRDGYGATDPKGSVTIVDTVTNTSKSVDFTAFDTQRESLANSGIILKKGALPSNDFEPEYISVSGNTAYISLQEANAIATLNITSAEFIDIKPLGFKNHNSIALDALKDGNINITTQDLYGVYMPDGIAVFETNGVKYLLTANEGDAREWGSDKDTTDSLKIEGKKVETLDVSQKDGLEIGKNYLLGGRSFSIYNADSMTQVYDSGSDFEEFIAENYPAFFNASHTNNELDSRSGKKGPEPEYVATINIDTKIYAFTGLERFGGVMMYDVTDPSNAQFYDYINTRKFDSEELSQMGDLGVEGLHVVNAEDSPTNRAILFTANEVSGTVAVFEIR
ncbi:MAG: choice-of-anchor I family protein [Campylobacteraceae bacterium]|nr:choice-of-anchor I family protein [Campylobacteraceae bacterium]